MGELGLCPVLQRSAFVTRRLLNLHVFLIRMIGRSTYFWCKKQETLSHTLNFPLVFFILVLLFTGRCYLKLIWKNL